MQNPVSPKPYAQPFVRPLRSRPHNTISAILRFFGVVIVVLFLIGLASG